jgi:hypothetical protein
MLSYQCPFVLFAAQLETLQSTKEKGKHQINDKKMNDE